MLKRSYATKEEIPAAYQNDYVEKDGRWVVDVEGFDNVEKVLEKNRELLADNSTVKSEISSLRGQVTKLNNDKAELAVRALPDGHVAIPVVDKQLLDAVKPLGTVDEIKTKVAEYPKLKEQAETVTRQQKLSSVAQVLGFNADVFSQLPGLPAPESFEVRDRTENGQVVKNAKGETEKVVIVKLQENGQAVEKNFLDYFNSNSALKLFEPALKAGAQQQQQQTRQVPHQTGNTGAETDDPVAKRLAAREEARQQNPNPLMVQTTQVGAGGKQAAGAPPAP
jgi:hypothetical protein